MLQILWKSIGGLKCGTEVSIFPIPSSEVDVLLIFIWGAIENIQNFIWNTIFRIIQDNNFLPNVQMRQWFDNIWNKGFDSYHNHKNFIRKTHYQFKYGVSPKLFSFLRLFHDVKTVFGTTCRNVTNFRDTLYFWPTARLLFILVPCVKILIKLCETQ